MATLAAYPEWYDRSGKIVEKSDITEVEICNSYKPTGSEVASWDASLGQDGSVMAYLTGTKVTLVCASLTEIPDKMFCRFTSLQKVTGLQNVTKVGAWSFLHTAVLASVDFVLSKLTDIGHDAFRGSDIEDTLDLSAVSLNIIGDRATRKKRWSDAGLAAVRAVAFPKERIYLEVPNADSQKAYPDVPYAIHNGQTISIATGACRTVSCYHIWNYLYAGTDKEFPNFLSWFNSTLNAENIGMAADRCGID